MFDFISLGSGSSGNCYFLFTDNDGFIIDAGVGTRLLNKRLIENGLSIRQIKHILITHDHADHIKSAGSLSAKLDISVYATSIVHESISKNYAVRKKIPSKNRIYIEKGKDFSFGDFIVTPFEVPHDSSDNVGYRIEYHGIVLCLITDAGCVTEKMKEIISQADYLIIEANHDKPMLINGPYPEYLKKRILSDNGHLSNDACAEAIAENASEKLKHIWLCHLSETNNTPERANLAVKEKIDSDGHGLRPDLQLDVLKRKQATGIFHLE